MTPEDAQILHAWRQNGPQWIRLIEEELIPSRQAGTNEAIIQAILRLHPHTLLDVGCGEGWVCRELTRHEIDCTGIDGVKELVEYAREKGSGRFLLASYQDLIHQKLLLQDTYELILFNYSLFGAKETEEILRCVRTHLTEDGNILIQTIHPQNPLFAQTKAQWIQEDWKNFQENCHPYQWYFRDEAAWHKLFDACGLRIVWSESVYLPHSSDPFSLLLQLKP
ncbi:MAG: class I SAM-dependent methyltransferase [Bacteroidota bacterium]